MQLTGFESVKKGFIKGGHSIGTKIASYDVRIDKIIISGKERNSSVTVEPHQTFILVSKETIEVPEGFVGYVHPNDFMSRRNSGA